MGWVIGMANALNGYTHNLTCTYNVTNFEFLPSPTNSSTFDPTAYYQLSATVQQEKLSTWCRVRASAPGTASSSSTAAWRSSRGQAFGLPSGCFPSTTPTVLAVKSTDLKEYCKGIDHVGGSLNWGPLWFLNTVSKTFGWWTRRCTDYGKAFHSYVLEWTCDFLRIYLDTRLRYMHHLSFNEPSLRRVPSTRCQRSIPSQPWSRVAPTATAVLSVLAYARTVLGYVWIYPRCTEVRCVRSVVYQRIIDIG
ncbi:hypothetical protein BS17DRAFT_848609 [Gyrodon lividus]|nr:hypothetical protein BS17DRAFT_848609 [Gyrodon lividus]